MRRGNFASNGQTKSRAVRPAGDEGLEDAFAVGGRNSRSIVDNDQSQTFAFRGGNPACPYDHFAIARCVPDGVQDKVVDGASQLRGVDIRRATPGLQYVRLQRLQVNA